MSINATVDGTTYNGVETITVGGKSIALAESGAQNKLTLEYNNLNLSNRAANLIVSKDLLEIVCAKDTGDAQFGGVADGIITENNLTIKLISNTKVISLYDCCAGAQNKKLVIDFDTSYVTNWSLFCRLNKAITEISPELDFSSATNVGGFCAANDSLTTVRFKPNTLSLSMDCGWSNVMSDDTFVSIANGLSSNAQGQTVTFKAAAKSYLNSLMGTVSNGVFTKDSGGSTSLSSFITNTKGWTIA